MAQDFSRFLFYLALLCAISAPSAAYAAVSFSGGWEQGTVTEEAGWKYTHKVGDYSYKIVTDIVRQGAYAARVEVRPGDNPLNCCGGTERSEVFDMGNASENLSSGTKYFSYSVRLDPNWQSPSWTTILQLHGPDEYGTNPSFGIFINDDRFSIATRAGDLRENSSQRYYRLSKGSINKGHWVDFIIKITFAVNNSGAIKVWRRDEGETSFKQVLNRPHVPTLQYKGGAVGDHYWRMGLYRSAQNYTNVLWNDAVFRGNTFEEVRAAAFPSARTP